MSRQPVTTVLAFALIAITGPVLLFPDILPAISQTTIVPAAALALEAMTMALLWSWRRARPALGVFLLAVLGSWWSMSSHDVLSIRHVASLSVSLLGMAIVATWCTTEKRLLRATQLFAGGAIIVLAVGLIGTQIYPSKFMGAVTLVPEFVYFRMPRVQLGMPGLEENGFVNPNGLAGTALLLLPTCGGLIAATVGRRRPGGLVLGALAVALATATLLVTLSRTALLAVPLTLAVLGLRWRKGRWWVALALVLAVAGIAYQADRSHAATASKFDAGATIIHTTTAVRIDVWRDGLRQLRMHPWLGIGLNQFHDITPTAENNGLTRAAHAHNIFLQVALDTGCLGLGGYLWLLGCFLRDADRSAGQPGSVGCIAAGAGLSLVAVHLFGLDDAIALGAKVGLFQWLAAGLILAAGRISSSSTSTETRREAR